MSSRWGRHLSANVLLVVTAASLYVVTASIQACAETLEDTSSESEVPDAGTHQGEGEHDGTTVAAPDQFESDPIRDQQRKEAEGLWPFMCSWIVADYTTGAVKKHCPKF
jgi:hypothetical protein